MPETLTIGGKTFTSRLMLGTGKFTDHGLMREALEASGTGIVTVAIRRVELGAPGHAGLLDALDLDRYQLLPNTAGCRTAQEAAYADKSRKILGVTVFPNADDKPPEVETPDPSAFAVQGPDVRLPGPDSHCPALTPVRFAAAFEGA